MYMYFIKYSNYSLIIKFQNNQAVNIIFNAKYCSMHAQYEEKKEEI